MDGSVVIGDGDGNINLAAALELMMTEEKGGLVDHKMCAAVDGVVTVDGVVKVMMLHVVKVRVPLGY